MNQKISRGPGGWEIHGACVCICFVVQWDGMDTRDWGIPWDWVGCPVQSRVFDDRMDTRDWGIVWTGWDVPYSPMCLMVQWDGMDTGNWGYSVGLGGMSHTVACV